jgi:transposase-like protein
LKKRAKKRRQGNKQVALPRRAFDPQYKVAVAKRLLAGEGGSKLSRKLKIRRSVLYRWRDTYRLEGAAGLNRQPGRPPGQRGRAAPDPAALGAIEQADAARAAAAARRISELERKVGQQAVQIDFLRRAFERVKKLGRPSGGSRAPADLRRSPRRDRS